MKCAPAVQRALLAVLAAAVLAACAPPEPKAAGAPPAMRRLSNDQYRNVVSDVFGTHVTVAGQADALPRNDGLLAVGARSARITPSGFEKYYAMARSVADQAVGEDNRASLFDCVPQDPRGADEACARRFYGRVGRLLYRRPPTPAELDVAVRAAGEGARVAGDFYRGVAAGLVGMLQSPQFLFVVDATEPDPQLPGQFRLTAYAKAARLSFLLWNTTPDESLLTAAEQGALHDRRGLRAQVERMMGSPRFENGMRAFFDDFLHFDQFETLEKDSVIYPAFSVRVVEDAREQVLRTVVDHLLERRQDYRDLFTTRRTFVTGSLARIYRVPTPRPEGSAWVPFEFPADDPRAGLLMQVGFAALASHPGRSSPTLRGRAIRENLLCQKVPDPPGNVDFALFESAGAQQKTARERLALHSTAPACAGCHKITDPIGLALENLDGLGQFRHLENEAPIDASGDLDGVAFTDAAGLGRAMHDNPAASACVVQRLAAYAFGRPVGPDEKPFLAYLNDAFERDGFVFPELVRRVASSDTLYAVKLTDDDVPPFKVASAAMDRPLMEAPP
jgi:hypothetical protein